MTLYAKIGTLPATYVHVVRKRKAPVVGEVFLIKEHNNLSGWKFEKPRSVLLREIKGGLYFLERF